MCKHKTKPTILFCSYFIKVHGHRGVGSVSLSFRYIAKCQFKVSNHQNIGRVFGTPNNAKLFDKSSHACFLLAFTREEEAEEENYSTTQPPKESKLGCREIKGNREQMERSQEPNQQEVDVSFRSFFPWNTYKPSSHLLCSYKLTTFSAS